MYQTEKSFLNKNKNINQAINKIINKKERIRHTERKRNMCQKQ